MRYDIVVIGGGVAGLTAGIYAARAGVSVAVVEKQFAGGQITSSDCVENYPAFSSISGVDLAMKMLEQAESAGVKMIYDTAVSADIAKKDKVIILEHGGEISCRAVILAMGAAPRRLGLDNEVRYIGKGVSYCALCDGAFYKNKRAVVIGGGNTAVGDAVYLSRFASEVYLVHRRDEFRATAAEMKKLYDSPVKIITNSIVTEIRGVEHVASVSLKNTVSGEESVIDTDGIFVAIGNIPSGRDIAPEVARDSSGYIIAGEDTCTNMDGVFVVGDIRTKSVRQVVTAVSDGAVAADKAVTYLQ